MVDLRSTVRSGAGLLCAGVMLSLSLCLSTADAASKADVASMKKELKEHQESIAKNRENLKELELLLQRYESEIARINQQLSRSKTELTNAQHRLARLKAEQRKLLKEKEIQTELLSRQIAEAYKLGSSDYVKLVFNQEDPNLIGRALEYHGYINRARADLIEDLEKLIAQTRKNQTEIEGNNQELKAIIENHDSEAELLKLRKKKEQETYAVINQNIRNEEKKVEVLKSRLQAEIEASQKKLAEQKRQQEESRIAQAKAEAEKQGLSADDATRQTIEQIERERPKGLKSQKGKLIWPVTGRVVKRFGESRAGELKWSGMLLQSGRNAGNGVVSIADGDVVMASPLEGYGIIVVVDHGEGYLSVYGNNQKAVRKVGEHVRTGDLLSYYDQSNHSLESSLYFEIRYKGSPVNPQKWLRKN